MKLEIACLASVCVVAWLLAACSTRRIPESSVPEEGLDVSRPAAALPAGDPRFRYEGRFDFADSNAPVAIWQASRIRLDFDGGSIALRFDNTHGQNFFNAQVDGSNTIVALTEQNPVQIVTLTAPESGRHHLVLFKRSEASAGTARFCGVTLAAGARAWAPKPPRYKVRMEFYGDSIMAGACDEDGATDQWTDRRTHNSALSYVTLTATEFSADHRNISVSGMGIITGWTDVKAGEMWDRLYPIANSARAIPSKWIPQIVLVNLGENDDSFPQSQGKPLPAGFTDSYVAFVRGIRAAYPDAHIVLLRGGMYNGAKSQPLAAAWQTAVMQLEAADPAVSHFVFTHWSSNHPRVADHRALADELIAWLKTQQFMRSYL
jgi:lysophospholipase L1-like esterase